jgi:hypothetical protein
MGGLRSHLHLDSIAISGEQPNEVSETSRASEGVKPPSPLSALLIGRPQ